MQSSSFLFSPSVWLALAAVYWAAVTLLHETISNSVVVPFRNMLGGAPTECAFVLLTVGGIGALLWMVRSREGRVNVQSTGQRPEAHVHAENAIENAAENAPGSEVAGENAAPRRAKTVYVRWLVLVAVTVLSSIFLMVTRIEMAHFPQYAILATLLRLGGLSPASAYLAGQCGSIVDEGRQYLLHPRYTGYFDWNDLLINSVGLCIGLLLVSQGDVCRACDTLRSRVVARVSGAVLALGTGVLLTGLACGFVRAYVPLAAGQPPDPFPVLEGSRVLALFLREPPALWLTGPFGQYHVMGVAEGMLFYPLCSWLLFLCCCYRKKT